MLDYIIVGFGLAGANLAVRLEGAHKSFMVFEDGSQNSSKVAGGMMNPIILKRFSLAWNADEQMEKAVSQYRTFEEHLQEEFIFPLPVYRKFFSVEEQNNWFAASDNPQISPFLDPNLIRELNENIPSDYSFGRVLHTKRVDTKKLLSSYSNYLLRKKKITFTRFVYNELKFLNGVVEYRGVKAKNIIFCEGFGILKNPYFKYLPLTGNKGEYIIIKAKGLKLNAAVKASLFIFPIGNNLYKVGATYNNHDKTSGPTLQAREELTKKLDSLITTKYEIVDQVAGIRPSTGDRRPLVGRHPEIQNMYCCNGFGSRGVLIAPSVSEGLLRFIENSEALSSEVNISRFNKRWGME